MHLSAPTVAVTRDQVVLVSWSAEKQGNQLYLARPTMQGTPVVRVNPAELTVVLASGPRPGGRPRRRNLSLVGLHRAETRGDPVASDLRLSRSVNGGQSFEPPLRINDDRPISHSFEGLAVAADGTVLVAWIDSREGANQAGTYLARLTHQGTHIASRVTLDSTTCVCCRVALATGPPQVVAVTWRTVLPGNIRDMVLRLAHDGGQVFTPATRIHADDWQLTACPHRGGTVGVDGQGRLFLSWYTEGTTEEPRLLFTVSSDGQQFASPPAWIVRRPRFLTTSGWRETRPGGSSSCGKTRLRSDAVCCSVLPEMAGRRSVPSRPCRRPSRRIALTLRWRRTVAL